MPSEELQLRPMEQAPVVVIYYRFALLPVFTTSPRYSFFLGPGKPSSPYSLIKPCISDSFYFISLEGAVHPFNVFPLLPWLSHGLFAFIFLKSFRAVRMNTQMFWIMVFTETATDGLRQRGAFHGSRYRSDKEYLFTNPHHGICPIRPYQYLCLYSSR